MLSGEATGFRVAIRQAELRHLHLLPARLVLCSMNPAALEYLNSLKERRPEFAAELTRISDDYRNK